MRFSIASVLVGVSSGLAGMSLALLLRFIQHVAYGQSLPNFLEDVQAASLDRRVLVLVLCGLLAGCGWWLIGHFGKPLVGIREAVASQKRMPFLTTLSHILLQIITVGMGSPLGREVAPRELAALVAAGLSSKLGLDPKETKILLACGAGAGLAAVYNVPLAGAVFVLEVLLCEFSIALLLRALVISGIAVAISWIGLGNHPAYEIPNLEISYSLVAWSVIAGPILGFSGYWFMRLATFARSKARSNWQTPVLCLLNFSLLGLLAIYFPALLGNGKSSALLVFDNTIGIGLTASLLILRILMTCLTLRAGAHGGLLTPSLANGALFSFLLGSLWSFFWPGTNLNTYAIVGAAAFLASAQKMPITALILIFEFTRVNPSFLLPVALCILGAFGTKFFQNWRLYIN